MRYHRSDVVERALDVLDRYGLADLSMRRLAGDLGVAPSALYHHVANKQTLLAAVADEILARGRRTRRATDWDGRVIEVCDELRDSMLAFRDGADVVATVHAFGLGAAGPAEELDEILLDTGLDDDLAAVATRTLLHYVFGHAHDEQTTLQANSAGAIDRRPRDSADFQLGLGLILDGLRTHVVELGRTTR
ncbi:TetR/AcrR family transcriptional regulator C-terminal domain-containing protein [Nocardioides sp. InS609-2]|uniref:TetR/AcrR family transcriptional regulator C-terminal domain-containing protein n=1 Tax=Nocardioides sp. InS609-2 TaxID=2760705 RepID=UPI0020C05E9B|nr:TetR/AcrR family transcriptional regulator C-terminal domain-containing protein [Nocardioides sp. InS609-2]